MQAQIDEWMAMVEVHTPSPLLCPSPSLSNPSFKLALIGCCWYNLSHKFIRDPPLLITQN